MSDPIHFYWINVETFRVVGRKTEWGYNDNFEKVQSIIRLNIPENMYLCTDCSESIAKEGGMDLNKPVRIFSDPSQVDGDILYNYYRNFHGDILDENMFRNIHKKDRHIVVYCVYGYNIVYFTKKTSDPNDNGFRPRKPQSAPWRELWKHKKQICIEGCVAASFKQLVDCYVHLCPQGYAVSKDKSEHHIHIHSNEGDNFQMDLSRDSFDTYRGVDNLVYMEIRVYCTKI